MPIYEYDCPACGRFEVIQKFSDKELRDCPNCQEKGKKLAVKRAVSVSSFHLKGGGWYKTDYGSSGSGSTGATKKKGSGSSEGSSSSGSKDDSGSSASSSETPKAGCGTSCGCH